MTVTDWIERRVRFKLVPVCHRRDVILPLEIAGFLGADLLPGDAKVRIEINRIRNVPAVQAAHDGCGHIPVVAFAVRGKTLRIERES